MNEEKKGLNFDFLTNIFSPPCVILAEIVAIYLTYNQVTMPDTFVSWLLFIGECLFTAIGVLLAVFVVMLVALLIIGGIAPNVSEKYIGIFLEIVVFILALIFIPSFL